MILSYKANKKRRSECFDLNIEYNLNNDSMEANLLVHHYNYPPRKTFFMFTQDMKFEFIEIIVDKLKEDTNYKFGVANIHYPEEVYLSTLEWIVFDNKKLSNDE